MADLMHTIYTDVAGFQADALSVLKQDLTLNTVCLSELNLIKPDDQAPGTYMAIYHCKQCSNKHHCVALSAGSRGGSHRLYLSESVCPALAKYIIEQLQQQGCTIPSLTAVDRVAGLLADESGFSGRQINNIMVLPPHAAAAAARPAAATGLSLKLLSRDSQSDVDFIMLWSTNFIQASMGSPILPPEQIVKSFVLPWLTEGQYVLAVQADDVPVCMLCHMQTSESSCRIVWVYTPPEHRRQGHARTAGAAAYTPAVPSVCVCACGLRHVAMQMHVAATVCSIGI